MKKFQKIVAVFSLLWLVIESFTILSGGCHSKEQQRESPQHVLLVVIDTQRADYLSPYGADPQNSPHLSALAERGVVFERAYAQCSWTAPSMVSLMTGRRLQSDRLDIPKDESGIALPTLAGAFQQSGFTTAAFICNDIINEGNGFAAGFDRFEQHTPYFDPNEHPVTDWIDSIGEEPTFTYLHLNEPHDPYLPPEESFRLLLDPPSLDVEEAQGLRDVAKSFDLEHTDESLAEIARERAGYADDVRHCDQMLGAIFARLETRGLLEQTAIVITSDHGEGLWTRPSFESADLSASRRKASANNRPIVLTDVLKMTHGSQVYPELVHVPLIIAGPGIDQSADSKRVSTVVENVDIVPTLLDWCNLPSKSKLDGRSLLEAVDDSASFKEAKTMAFSATLYNSTVITQSGWQLICPSLRGACLEGDRFKPELYYLPDDPQAQSNLAAAEPELVEELIAAAEAVSKSAVSGVMDTFAIERNEEILSGLGYIESGLIDQGVEAFLNKSTAELLSQLADSGDNNACMDCLYAAEALLQRRAQLSPAELARLSELAPTQRFVSVRKKLEEALRQ